MKNLPFGARSPFLIKAFSQSAGNVLWFIASTRGRGFCNEISNCCDILAKVLNRESVVVIAMVSVTDETHSDFEIPIAACDYVFHDLDQGFLSSVDPRIHGGGAIA